MVPSWLIVWQEQVKLVTQTCRWAAVSCRYSPKLQHGNNSYGYHLLVLLPHSLVIPTHLLRLIRRASILLLIQFMFLLHQFTCRLVQAIQLKKTVLKNLESWSISQVLIKYMPAKYLLPLRALPIKKENTLQFLYKDSTSSSSKICTFHKLPFYHIWKWQLSSVLWGKCESSKIISETTSS